MDLRELPRVVWVLAAARFVSSAASFTMLFLTLYLTGPRDVDTSTAGLVAGGVGVGMLAGNFTGGRWGDRFGHRQVLLVASSTGGLLLATVPLMPVWLIAVALPVAAYLMATGSVSSGALSALAVPRGERRTAVAVSRAASNAGFVLGPPLGALLVTWSYDAMFVVDGLVVVLVRLALGRVLPPDAPDVASGTPGHGMWRAVRSDRSLVVLLVGAVSRSNHPMSSCSSVATFAGVPCHTGTSQALSSAGSSARPAVTRHRWDVEPAAICTPSSSCSSRASASSSDSPSSMTPPGRSHTPG